MPTTLEVPQVDTEQAYRNALFQTVETGERPHYAELADIFIDAGKGNADFKADCETLRQRFELHKQREELPSLRVRVNNVKSTAAAKRGEIAKVNAELQEQVNALVAAAQEKADAFETEAVRIETKGELSALHKTVKEYAKAEQRLLDTADPSVVQAYNALAASDSKSIDCDHRRRMAYERIRGKERTVTYDSETGEWKRPPKQGKDFWEKQLAQAEYLCKTSHSKEAEWKRQRAQARVDGTAEAEQEIKDLDAECKRLEQEKQTQLAELRERMLDWRLADLTSY